MKRVIVIGRGASGKSTLARRLSEISQLPVIELDKIFWQRGLVATPREQWIVVQEKLAAEPEWIMDGDLGPYDAIEVRLRRADTIVFLDFSLLRCLWRAIRRSRERLDFWHWVFSYRRKYRPQLLATISQHAPNVNLMIFSSPRDLRRFLDEITKHPSDSEQCTAMETIPSEPYPELPLVLERFAAGTQTALRKNFVGAYLVGSLATGDFDLDSDIDFLVITNNEMTDAEVRSIQALHCEIYDLGCYAAQHLEGSYISRAILNRDDFVGVQPLWYIDNGSTLLTRSVHDNHWHVRWILREQAITLRGPDLMGDNQNSRARKECLTSDTDPKILVQRVPIEVLRAEILASVEDLRVRFLAEVEKPLGYFNTRFGQSFTVLTCCRMLHTFKTGLVKSKRYAAQWAEQSVEPEWNDLIRQAWTERDGVRFCTKIRQLSDKELLKRTAQFIAYAQSELRP